MGILTKEIYNNVLESLHLSLAADEYSLNRREAQTYGQAKIQYPSFWDSNAPLALLEGSNSLTSNAIERIVVNILNQYQGKFLDDNGLHSLEENIFFSLKYELSKWLKITGEASSLKNSLPYFYQIATTVKENIKEQFQEQFQQKQFRATI